MRPDHHLIHSAKHGDRTAAETLFRRYQDRIYGFLFKLTGDPDLAADAMQETLIRGFKGLSGYQEKHIFKSWIFRIARNEGLRCMQKRSRMPVSGGGDTIPEFVPDQCPGPDETYEAKERTLTLEQALSHLSSEEQQVVHLRMRENVSFKDIAAIMDCPLNTAVGRMHNAKKKLQQLMTGEV